MAKRIFDIFFAVLGLTLLWPLFLVVAVFILVEDGGPVFFRQQRVGRYGHLFKIWKFRTMKIQNQGLSITVAGDRRITKIGGLLRKYKIDELPQLINVLFGEMSFVGPRPEVEKYVSLYSEEQRKILQLRPGITDEASITFRNESDLLNQSDDPEALYVNKIMPEKINLNLRGMRRHSLYGDIRIIFLTILRIIQSD